MQIRQALRHPEFLKSLGKARTENARALEMSRLVAHEKTINENMKISGSDKIFDLDFQVIRAFLSSQYTIQCLYEFTEKAADHTITDSELKKLVSTFLEENNLSIKSTRVDYFPMLPIDGHELLWQLAKLINPTFSAKVLIPTLERMGYMPFGQIINQASPIILSEKRTHAISLVTFLNRLARDEGFKYYNPIGGPDGKGVNALLTDDEKIRLLAALSLYKDPLVLRGSSKGEHKRGDIKVVTMLQKLREECAILLNVSNESQNIEYDARNRYYDTDKKYYHKILGESWLLKNPAFIFESMACLAVGQWDVYVKAIFQQQKIENFKASAFSARDAVKNKAYYTKSDLHNAAVLYFFTELYLQNRDDGYEYNSFVPRAVSYISTTAADAIAFNKTQKEAAARILQTFLISGKPLTRASMRAYFIEQGPGIEALLAPLCEVRSELNAIVEQIDILGQIRNQASQMSPILTQATMTTKQGLFAGQPLKHQEVTDGAHEVQGMQLSPTKQ